jgi:serine/threonine protein kinase
MPRSLEPGIFIGEYRIERVLGQGGFGITYLAWDEELARWVAIKEYFPRGFAHREAGRTVTPNPDDQDRADFDWGMRHFVEEAKSLTRFRHRNIVGAIRFLRENGTAYLVMEYCDGESLEDRVKRDGALSSQELKPILDQLLDGLEEVHRANLLHLDLKPSNIFVKKDGTVVLLDFGSARQAISSHTKSVKVASAGYAALEQESADVEAGKLGAWTDIYGLGATLYRLMTGTRPQQATARVLQDGLVPLSEQTTVAHDPGLKKAVDAALNIRPQERPRSLQEFRRLLSLSTTSPAESKSTSDDKPETSASRSLSRSEWLLPIPIVVGVLLAAFHLTRSNPDDQGVAVNYGSADEGVFVEPTLLDPPPLTNNETPSFSSGVGTAAEATTQTDEVSCDTRPGAIWTGCTGTRNLADGSRYSGWWKDDLPHGWGRWYGADELKGHSYSGSHRVGLFSGRGTYTWPDGSQYVGNWSAGQKSGVGTYTGPDGSKYVGAWKEDKAHGAGTEFDAAGLVRFKGTWIEGNPVVTERKVRSSFELWNSTGARIWHVYVRPLGADGWMFDLLGSAVLPMDGKFLVPVGPDMASGIELRLCDDSNLEYVFRDINLDTAVYYATASGRTGSRCFN